MKIKELVESVQKNKKLLLVISVTFVIVFVTIGILFGLKNAFYSVYAWVAATFGLITTRREKRKIQQESISDTKNLEKKAEDVIRSVRSNDEVIDKQVEIDAQPPNTTEESRQRTLDLLDKLE